MRSATLAPLVVVVLGMALAGCHMLMNPADPNSPAYGGIPVEDGPLDIDKSLITPLLPQIVEWRSYGRHLEGVPGQPDQWIWYPIPADGSYIESREAPGLWLGIVFAEQPSDDARKLALAMVGVTDTGNPVNPPVVQVTDMAAGGFFTPTIILFPYPGFADGYGGSRVTIRIINGDGSVLSERSLAWLVGDVNGSGAVEGPGGPDFGFAMAHNGELASPANARGDVDTNGTIEEPGNDGAIITSQNGRSLASFQVPAF